jgi:hypothetical protein
MIKSENVCIIIFFITLILVIVLVFKQFREGFDQSDVLCENLLKKRFIKGC